MITLIGRISAADPHLTSTFCIYIQGRSRPGTVPDLRAAFNAPIRFEFFNDVFYQSFSKVERHMYLPKAQSQLARCQDSSPPIQSTLGSDSSYPLLDVVLVAFLSLTRVSLCIPFIVSMFHFSANEHMDRFL
jgi:hypothetical protein